MRNTTDPGEGGRRGPTSTELRHVNVPFSHPSGGRPQKDGRKVRSRCRPQSTLAAPPALPRNQPIQMIESGSLPSLRRLAMSKVRPSREGHPRASVPFAEIGSLPHRDRSGSAPRSVEFRTEIGPVPRRDRFSPASRRPSGRRRAVVSLTDKVVQELILSTDVRASGYCSCCLGASPRETR